MHVMIKDHYLNLDDVLTVSPITSIGGDGWRFFFMVYKQGIKLEFCYHGSIETDVKFKENGFYFGTATFFDNTHKKILNILANAVEFPLPR